jgi:membrane-bound ClpP family serine protease
MLSIVPFSNVVMVAFLILGLLPGILAVFGFRFIGLIGTAGIVVAIIWGFIHCMFVSLPWQYVFLLDFLRIYSVVIVFACVVQLIFIYMIPKKKTEMQKRNKCSNVDYDTSQVRIDESRRYEV